MAEATVPEFQICVIRSLNNVTACSMCKHFARNICEPCCIPICINCFDSHLTEKFKLVMRFIPKEIIIQKLNVSDHRDFHIMSMLKQRMAPKVDLKYILDMRGIYFYDTTMTDIFSCNPWFMAFHMVHLSQHNKFLILLIAEDTNAHCEIFGLGLLYHINDDSLFWLCKIMQKNNVRWPETKILLLDARINSEAFERCFPRVKIFPSRFHSFHTFETYIKQHGVTEKDSKEYLELFKNVLSSTSVKIYEVAWEKLINRAVLHNINISNLYFYHRPLSLEFETQSFLEGMDMFLKEIEEYYQCALSHNKSLKALLAELIEMIITQRKRHFLKISAIVKCLDVHEEDLKKYGNILTSHAVKLITSHFHTLEATNSTENRNLTANSDVITTTTEHCSCKFNAILELPCNHILNMRNAHFMPLFEQNLVGNCWYKSHNIDSYLKIHSGNLRSYEIDEKRTTNLNDCVQALARLMPLLSDATEKTASERCKLISCLLEAWQHDINVSVEINSIHSNIPTDETVKTPDVEKSGNQQLQQSDSYGLIKFDTSLPVLQLSTQDFF